MTRLCVLGGSGLIGSHVVHAAQAAGFEVTAPARRTGDLSDRAALERLVAAGRPDVIINAAGFTAVDAAEDAPGGSSGAAGGGGAVPQTECAPGPAARWREVYNDRRR